MRTKTSDSPDNADAPSRRDDPSVITPVGFFR